MRIGTTPTHTFTLPDDIAGSVVKVRVTYSQCGQNILSKEVTALEGNLVSVRLSQSETLKFYNKKPVDIQLKVKTNDGSVLTSDIITKTPYECLDREVLS